MKLEKILDGLNSLEKNAFIKIIDSIKTAKPKNAKQIDLILSNNQFDLKNADNAIILNIFELIQDEFADTIKAEFVNTTSQLDIFLDILIRDGNCILKQSWLAKLYEVELQNLKKKTNELKAQIISEKSEIEPLRKRDYDIYKSCVETAYRNDESNNRDAKITDDELSILVNLAKKLELSQEEVKLINYSIIPPVKMDIESAVSFLKNIGVIFFSRKSGQIYVADEVAKVLRQVRGKEVADKYFRRVLRIFKEPQINQICKKHSIDIKNLAYDEKIQKIIKEGVSFKNILINAIHKDGTKTNEKKKAINDLWENGLKIVIPLRGQTIEEKVDSIIEFFEEIERDEKVSISLEGYEKLLIDLNAEIPNFKATVFREFEMQDDMIVIGTNLLDFNIKPRDILDILSFEDLKAFASIKNIKSRGDLVQNILESYKDVENILIENYVSIAFRNLAELKSNNILIKESELGLKFEEITKLIFQRLGFNVDEELRNSLNTNKDKIDLILNLGNNEVIIVECKTVKESGYNKFSLVSRQIKSYVNLLRSNEFTVVKSLLVAPEFSDDFVNECDLEFEINLSLITASSLAKILEGFKDSRHKQFPYQLLLKDVLIKEERILKAIRK